MRAHVLFSFLLLGATAPLWGCGGNSGPGGNKDGGTASCNSDDDCDSEPTLRACRNNVCVDPGCPTGMTYVSAGAFTMGCDSSDTDCATDSQPAHQVTLSKPFCISRTELTVAQYRSCVTTGKCTAPADILCSAEGANWTAQAAGNEKQPMNCLYWADAQSACQSLGSGFRLPTEAEWEKAARGRDQRIYPWMGSAAPMDCTTGVNWGGAGCSGASWPVGSGTGLDALSASFASDMAGNVWEWTADWFDSNYYSTSCASGCTDPTGPADGAVRVRRGGAFLSEVTTELRASYREFQNPSFNRSDIIGVRCAAPAP